MKKRWLVIGVILAGILMMSPVLACHTTTETETKETLEAERPEWNIGDRWIHKVIYIMKSGSEREGYMMRTTVFEKEEFEGTICYVISDSPNGFWKEYYTLDLNVKGFVNEGPDKLLGREKITPDSMQFSWPLKVGKKWKQSYTIVEESRGWGGKGELEESTRTVNATLEVVGVEKVETPAGEFVAFKIVKKVDDTVVEERWYSPAAKWFVKKITYFQKNDDPKRPKKEVWELTRYKVK